MMADEAPAVPPPMESTLSPAYAGWIRFDSDAVIRGWVTDRNRREQRIAMRVLIDDEVVVELVADRLDPKLVELGEGDGRYSFALVAPERFRDGAPHPFRAETADGLFRLKSKLEAFQVEPDRRPPALELSSTGYGVAEGRLFDTQLNRSLQLELYRNGVRLDPPLVTRWHGGAEMNFTVNFDPRLLHDEADLALAIPGMIEAGLAGAPVAMKCRLTAEFEAGGPLVVDLAGEGGSLQSWPLELRVNREEQQEPLLVRPIVLDNLPLRLDPAFADPDVSVAITIEGRQAAWLTASPKRVLGVLTRNSDFSDWALEGPADWRSELRCERGFFAFSAHARELYGARGDLVQVALAGATTPVRVLQQVLVPAEAELGDQVGAALLLRASAPAKISMRLLDTDGGVLSEIRSETTRPWAWEHRAEILRIGRAATADRLEIVAEAADDVILEVALARFGAAAAAAEARAEAVEQAVNLVENAELLNWPHGIFLDTPSGRSETAKDWLVINRRSPDAVRVCASIEAGDVGRASYLAAAAKVPHYCRIEVRLQAAVAALQHGELSFEIGSPLAARRLLSAAKAAIPEFQVIHRVYVVRRTASVGAEGALRDETVANGARSVFFTRHPQRVTVPLVFRSENTAETVEADGGERSAKYFLVFEFRGPFAVSLSSLHLSAVVHSEQLAAPPALSLEDRNIAAQAERMVGLKAWLSPSVIEPDIIDRSDLAASPPASIRRWRPSLAAFGTVEVVICVYNTPVEILACLTSLVGTSEQPHTVRIVDDGSTPEVARRIESFIADKPWMRLVRNATNLGYTRSADRGVRESEAEWVVLLNSDTIVTNGWLEGMLEAARSSPDVGFVGPLSNAASFQSVPDVYDARGGFAVNELPPGWTPERMAEEVAACSEKRFPEVPLLNGFCTLMNRALYLEIGGLNRTAFPSGYGEENDLCTRAVKAGYKLVIADQVYVYHTKSASFGAARRSELAKAGAHTIKALHPDVDFGAAVTRFRDIPSLVRLRAALRERLDRN